ncbi:uncharacterized protein LOC142586184 [Dermacentor variabilis]|uniref:uncharacterized protein LOC142586184 n=1 Tax=Dermacentor variabilis TaxID=34621 RepID=UPI003F5B8B08
MSKRSARSDGAVSRGSLPDRVSPPRRISPRNSKIRSDESQSDRRSGALRPRTPRDRSSLPHKMPSKVSQMSDDFESMYSRSDLDLIHGSPRYPVRPSGMSSKTSRARDDYESRTSQRGRARSLDSPPHHSSPPRKGASGAPRVRDGYELRSERRSGAHRHDSPPDRSSPPRMTSYRSSTERDDHESRISQRSSTRRYDSALGRSSPPRRTSRTLRERDDYKSRSERRSRGRRPDSPRDLYSSRRSASDESRVRDEYESRFRRRSGSRRYGSAPIHSSPLKGASWTPDSTRDLYSPRRSASDESRVRDESRSHHRSGSRRYGSPPVHSSPQKGASWTSWFRNKYFSRTSRQSEDHSPRIPPVYSSSRRASPKTSRKSSDFESSTTRWSGARRSERGSPPRTSASKESGRRDDFEPRSRQRSGSIGPANRSSAPSKKPSPSNVCKASTSRGQEKEGKAGHEKPAPKADTAVKPSASATKQKAGLICCGCGHVLVLPKPTDDTTADKDAQKPKPAEGPARGDDIERSMHGESEEEESEETPQAKSPESPPSEEYVPTSEAGQVAPQVVESLGPFSDDDDEEYQGEGEYYADSSIGWFRTWVLCSVAAIVLMVPFALTFMSYQAAGRLHGMPPPPFAVEVPAESLEVANDSCEPPDYSKVEDVNLKALPSQKRTPSKDIVSLRRVFCVYDILYV